MGYRAAEGPVTSFNMAAILGAILDFTKNKKLSKMLKSGNFYAVHVEYDIIKDFAAFCRHLLHFSPKTGKKHEFVFKNGFTFCYL